VTHGPIAVRRCGIQGDDEQKQAKGDLIFVNEVLMKPLDVSQVRRRPKPPELPNSWWGDLDFDNASCVLVLVAVCELSD
jgi:hypothetical protein